LQLGCSSPTWVEVDRDHPLARALVDGETHGGHPHYSRQTPGASEFMPPGETLVLLTPCGRAVWGVCMNLDPAGNRRWRVTVFRNEGAGLSSELVREATIITRARWPESALPLVTEIDPAKTRRKRDPGRCFRRAGWADDGLTRSGLVRLRAP
jgi:hypothetical protein